MLLYNIFILFLFILREDNDVPTEHVLRGHIKVINNHLYI